MFTSLTLHGLAASILWGYRPAVELTSWQIAKREGQWTLTGVTARVDPFQARQKPLLFAAPRPQGFWAWPIDGVLQISEGRIMAKLGPPEQ